MSKSLLFKNRPEFFIINETSFDSNFIFLLFGIHIDSLVLTNSNPFAFLQLMFLVVQGNLD
jgi:hypothetical protein